MKNVFKKIAVVFMAVVMGGGVLAGCKPNNETEDYSYRTYTTELPKIWNPHTYTQAQEATVLDYVTRSFVDVTLKNPAADDGEWEWTPDAASKMPEDVTTQFKGSANPYNIPDSATSGWAYKITLRNDLRWSNGDYIVAQDYVDSLKLMVDPKYSNYRASGMMTGDTLDIANLEEYVDAITAGESYDFNKVGYKALSKHELLIVFCGWSAEFYTFANMPAHLVLVHKKTYENPNNVTTLENGSLMTKYNTTVEASMSYGPYKLDSIQADKEMVFVKNPYWYGWKDDAFEGQYQTTRIVIKVINNSNTAMQNFDSGAIDTIGLNANTFPKYANSSNLVTEPTAITRRLSFCIDETKLAAIETANNVPKNLKYLANNTFRKAISYAINRQQLASAATAGSNPETTLLNNWWEHDYINNYGLKYRDTVEGMQVIAKLYGIEGYADMTATKLKEEIDKYSSGFAIDKAKTLFDEAVQEVDNGTLSGNIVIRLTGSAESDTMNKVFDEIIDQLAEATKGTKLEGKLSLVKTWNTNLAADMRDGNIECGFVAASRGYMYPDYQVAGFVWTAAGVIYEGGAGEKKDIDGNITEKGYYGENNLTININGVDIEKTFKGWGEALLTEYGDGVASTAVRLKIMTEIEYALLDLAFTVPLFSDVTYRLYSDKIINVLTEYNGLLAYGGIRYMKYAYNDAEWADYVINEGLDYTK